MKSKSPFNETVVANSLVAIFERLDDLEKAIASIPSNRTQGALVDALLRERLERLTIKRHAVLLATLGGVSYKDIAGYMACDITTVKLHLKAALTILGIQSRAFLLAVCGDMLDSITDREYEQRYGLSKRWWLDQQPALMGVLRATKPAKNQHTP